MIYLKTAEEIELMRQSALIVSKTLGIVGAAIKEGTTLKSLDKLAEDFIRDSGGVPVFKGYNGFPASLCLSLNEAVVHGIPNDTALKSGDIISVDCGVYKNGFHGDSAYTFAVGNVKPETLRLLKITKECLYKGIEEAVTGKRLGDISHAHITYLYGILFHPALNLFLK